MLIDVAPDLQIGIDRFAIPHRISSGQVRRQPWPAQVPQSIAELIQFSLPLLFHLLPWLQETKGGCQLGAIRLLLDIRL